MLSRITLPRIPDVGWRLQQAFRDQLYVQLDGAGWAAQGKRGFAAAPSETITTTAADSPRLWAHWRARWQANQTASPTTSQITNRPANGIDITGLYLPGWYGYLGYEAGRSPRTSAPGDLPVAALGFYPCLLTETATHLELCYLDSHQATAQKILHALESTTHAGKFQILDAFRADAGADNYHAAFERIKAYIHAGDCYQVNLARRFSAHYQGTPYAAYSSIERIMQSPFCGYVQVQQSCVMSFSPEQFIEVNDRHIVTSPIKGTRPRFAHASEDAASAEKLRNSPKDQAENLMIVDLLRNDLSKVAELGSVKVPRLFSIESFPHVHHMISKVEARLRSGLTPIDVLQSCFPGGSITGAPKRRACEIIDELEPFSRSAYCGSLVFLDVHDHMQSSILIRTLVAQADKLYCWGGGGIVADSVRQDEYEETLHKVGPLMRLLETQRS